MPAGYATIIPGQNVIGEAVQDLQAIIIGVDQSDRVTVTISEPAGRDQECGRRQPQLGQEVSFREHKVFTISGTKILQHLPIFRLTQPVLVRDPKHPIVHRTVDAIEKRKGDL